MYKVEIKEECLENGVCKSSTIVSDRLFYNLSDATDYADFVKNNICYEYEHNNQKCEIKYNYVTDPYDEDNYSKITVSSPSDGTRFIISIDRVSDGDDDKASDEEEDNIYDNTSSKESDTISDNDALSAAKTLFSYCCMYKDNNGEGCIFHDIGKDCDECYVYNRPQELWEAAEINNYSTNYVNFK